MISTIWHPLRDFLRVHIKFGQFVHMFLKMVALCAKICESTKMLCRCYGSYRGRGHHEKTVNDEFSSRYGHQDGRLLVHGTDTKMMYWIFDSLQFKTMDWHDIHCVHQRFKAILELFWSFRKWNKKSIVVPMYLTLFCVFSFPSLLPSVLIKLSLLLGKGGAGVVPQASDLWDLSYNAATVI